MIGKLDDYLRFNEAALSLRAQRQQVLASNIANADTPNYKARDFDFADALKGALGSGAGAGAPTLRATAPGHYSTAGGASADKTPEGTALRFRSPAQGALDGNTVDMDVERNQFADNAVRYETGLTMMSGQVKALMAAIQGGN